MSVSRTIPAEDSYLAIRLETQWGINKYVWLSDYDSAKKFIEEHLPIVVGCKVGVELIEDKPQQLQ